MDAKTYQAPLGFTIISVVLECVHCNELIPGEDASAHKLGHSIEKSREKGSGKRQCSCPYGQIVKSCPKHGHIARQYHL